MLRTNLSTRPFYNERAVRGGIAVLVLLAAALTTFNGMQIMSLSSRNGELASRAEAAENKARELRNQARVVRQSLNRQEVDAVQAEAREANLLIDRRAFSWTDLFNRFEETLPPDVRIVAITPQTDTEGRMLVAVTTISRKYENLDTFVERLEDTGAFSGVISRQDETLDDGTLRSVIQGYYKQVSRPAAVSSPPASDSNDAAANTSPVNRSPTTAKPRLRSAEGKP
ncbi:MAG TPA: hypothetical protein VEK56_08130 [Vicinamibacterales bacterium]|nr:hypothetical protein [Vicinamibacterales bacterium]